MSRPNRALLPLLLALFGVGAWMWLGQDEKAPLATGEAQEAPEREPESGTTLAGESESAGARDEIALPEQAPTEPEVVEEDLEVRPYVTRNLSGTLTLLDEHGNGPFLEDGAFGFWLWQGEDRSYHEVIVERGKWETLLPADVRISLGEVELGGRVAAFLAEDGPPIEIPPSGVLDLEAYLPHKSILRVYDMTSREELNDVTVVFRPKSEASVTHPGSFGAENRVVEGVNSPIELEARAGYRIDESLTYYVKAAGYGWGRITLKHSTGGAHEIFLRSGGALAVKLSEFEPDLFPTFRLWSFGRPFAEVPLEWEREFQIDDIPAGYYFAAVEIGRDWNNVVRIASEEVEIHPGAVTSIQLTLDEGPEYKRADLTGTLIVPSEWKLPSFRILLRLQDKVASRRESFRMASSVELANIPGREDAWSFRFPELIEGTWQFGIEPTLYATRIQVEVDREGEIEIRVPPPADWIVKARDPHTGNAAAIEELEYNVPGGYTTQAKAGERIEGRVGEFSIRAPQGRVTITARGENYWEARERVVLDAPEGEVVIDVPSLCGVQVAITHNGSRISWGESYVMLKDSEGAILDINASLDDSAVVLYAKEPGAYIVELHELEGYQAPSPIDVLIEAAEVAEIEIPVVRE